MLHVSPEVCFGVSLGYNGVPFDPWALWIRYVSDVIHMNSILICWNNKLGPNIMSLSLGVCAACQPFCLLSLLLWLWYITRDYVLCGDWITSSLEFFVISLGIDVYPWYLGAYLRSSLKSTFLLSLLLVGLGVDYTVKQLLLLIWCLQFEVVIFSLRLMFMVKGCILSLRLILCGCRSSSLVRGYHLGFKDQCTLVGSRLEALISYRHSYFIYMSSLWGLFELYLKLRMSVPFGVSN